MPGFIPGINNLGTLFSYTNWVTTTVNQETEALMRQQGTLLNGMDLNQSLSAITNAAVSDARALVDQVKTTYPEMPDYQPNSFNMPASYNNTISAAMTSYRDIQAQIAADPTFKGTPTEATLREIRQLELTEQQNQINAQLSENIGVLAANTTGLTDILDDLVRNSTSSNNMLSGISNTLNGIQTWLFNLEQQLAAQTSAAEAAAQAAAAAAEAADTASELAANAATAAEATAAQTAAATTTTTV